jgi:hypothetical protein
MGTEHPKYHAKFAEVVNRGKEDAPLPEAVHA